MISSATLVNEGGTGRSRAFLANQDIYSVTEAVHQFVLVWKTTLDKRKKTGAGWRKKITGKQLRIKIFLFLWKNVFTLKLACIANGIEKWPNKKCSVLDPFFFLFKEKFYRFWLKNKTYIYRLSLVGCIWQTHKESIYGFTALLLQYLNFLEGLALPATE